ncbi:electron transport complex subunit RsxC [Colwellia echini]|uniref:Ion-translocating oxidoreductase complex subunit C n=1 Tax=Colwellia echini TaxID=1982103 RepID=A0ABY3MUZ9_9GAMM|nr:electron transport complex subunit RsxC [Colwellia echini]TYK64917.1 electron transport complex subunit RsxC [Colwellia echini]
MMESVIARITRGQFWDFHGGIHPPEQKTLTSTKPIKQLTLPKQLIIPLQQHIGLEGDVLVSIGEHVLKGQPLTGSTNPMEVPIHAPTSGTITAIKMSVIAHPSGLEQLCIFLDVDGLDTWRKRIVCPDLSLLSNHEIIEKIADSGIAGMGGAGFPTHIKANSKPDINFLIINGAECEPYITSDDLLMMEQSIAIVDGIEILDRLLSPAFILIGIEDNKPKAIKALQQATKDNEKIKVCVVPTKYPIGGEKQLIHTLTGQEVPAGQLPIHSGIVMQNVATCFAINEAVRHDTPLIRRVVTVTGQALNKPQNVWALIGTPINFLLEQCEVEAIENVKQPVIMGGPMMGFSIASDIVPIIKTSNCILVPSKKEMPSAFEKESQEVECIRCGQCSDVCPSNLLPQELQWSAKAKDHPQLQKLNLSDCIECGACAYVCPSQIPLVHYYRIAKAEIREQHQLDLKAEKAKVRFEARKMRLEKEKIARQEKNKKAAAARKAAMNKATPEATGAKSAVAAALARVKAKKAAQENPEVTKPVDSAEVSTVEVSATEIVNDQKSQVAAAIARAKAKKKLKEASAQQSEASTTNTEPNKISENNAETEQPTDQKSKVAAAIARAKAKKKLKEASAQQAETKNTETEITTVTENTIGKETIPEKSISEKKHTGKTDLAKAGKHNSDTNIDTDTDTNTSDISDISNANITNTNDIASELVHAAIPAAIDKKAKMAAAIAKAKAKKKLKDAATKESAAILLNEDKKDSN